MKNKQLPQLNKTLNLALLIGGYAVGQGILFAAQTWLIINDRLLFLAAFGIHFSFAMLAIIIVDFGFLIVLAKETVTLSKNKEYAFEISKAYWLATTCRIIVVFIVLFFAALWYYYSDNPFSRNYLLFAFPAIFIWAFNFSGLFDGLRMSGISGISGALPFIISALALPIAVSMETSESARLLGAAFTIGYISCVGVQYIILKKIGLSLKLVKPSKSGLIFFARNGSGALLTMLPGQVYFRIQLGISANVLGEATTALFIYAKQIVTAFAQLIGFLRRIEFPDLVNKLHNQKVNLISIVFSKQKIGTLVSIFLSLLVFALALLFSFYASGSIASSAKAVIIFAPLIATSGLSLAVMQGLLGLGQYKNSALIVLLAVTIGSAISLLLTPVLGLFGLVISDIFVDLIILTMVIIAIKKYEKGCSRK